MRWIVRRLLLALLFVGLGINARAQQVRAVKLPVLKDLLACSADTTYVVNFWATWCKPCIQELPGFEAVRSRFAGRPVRLVLVSLDFRSKLESKVQPFAQQKNLRGTLWLLDETDANSFINQIEPSWSGSIPFTLVFNNARRQRQAFERPLSEAELTEAIQAASRKP